MSPRAHRKLPVDRPREPCLHQSQPRRRRSSSQLTCELNDRLRLGACHPLADPHRLQEQQRVREIRRHGPTCAPGVRVFHTDRQVSFPSFANLDLRVRRSCYSRARGMDPRSNRPAFLPHRSCPGRPSDGQPGKPGRTHSCAIRSRRRAGGGCPRPDHRIHCSNLLAGARAGHRHRRVKSRASKFRRSARWIVVEHARPVRDRSAPAGCIRLHGP